MGIGTNDMSTKQNDETQSRWYMVNKDGMVTLCADHADAEQEAKNAQEVWPHMGPHRAVQLRESSGAWFTAADMATAAAQGFREGQAAELAAMRAGGKPVAEMVPCHTPSGKRVAIISRFQHLPIGTKLYTHPQPDTQDAERWMELGQAIEQACMTLPEGVEVAMSFEQDAWKVKWFDENGNEHDTESHESGVASVMNDAIDTAIAAQGENKNMSERAFHTTGYITPAQPRTNDVARAIVEAADMNDRVLVAIDAEFAAPAQQPWKDTPPAQERIQALELEVRQLTEQIAELRHAPTPQADSQPAPLREGEWINDAGRIKWLMWRVQDLEAKLAARAPADSVLEDAYMLLQDVAACFTRDDDLPDNLLPRIDAALKARKQGANHDL